MTRNTKKASKKTTKKKSAEAPVKGLTTKTGRERKPVAENYKIVRSASPKPSKGFSAKTMRAQQFGQLLVSAMLAKGLKQIQLAELADVPRDSISGYCKGENIPGNDRLKKIADILEVKPEDLMPNFGRSSNGSSDMRLSVNDQGDGTSWLHVNRAVSSLLAAKIQLLITEEDGNRAKS